MNDFKYIISNAVDRIVEKITSGKWVLTVTCGVTFAWLAIDKTLPSEAVGPILASVFTHYFAKRPNEKDPSID